MAEDKKPGVPIEEQPPAEHGPEPPAPGAPETPPAPEPGAQGVIPGMEGPPPPENKVIDLSSVRAGAGQEQQDGRTTGRSPCSPGAGVPPCRGTR